jgi:DNA polymerase III delta prime subunit
MSSGGLILENNDLFEDFIFTDRLTKQLKVLVEKPRILRLRPILCFHGNPGVGKTSFGKKLMSHFCGDYQYFPMNERSLKNNFIEEQIKPLYRTVSLFDDGEKMFPRGIFLDEFNNLTKKEQERFKVIFDQMKEKDTLVIVCLNSIKGRLSKVLSDPIHSRVYPINFNVREEENEINEVLNKVMDRYPLLPRLRVRGLIPDMRKITDEGLMSELMNNEVTV